MLTAKRVKAMMTDNIDTNLNAPFEKLLGEYVTLLNERAAKNAPKAPPPVVGVPAVRV